ncbi:hypothetical protein D3C75_1283540 [compost metagenome]
MQIRFVAADLMGNLQIFTPVLVGFQASYPGDYRVTRRFAGTEPEGLDIDNVRNDITLQPGADGDE